MRALLVGEDITLLKTARVRAVSNPHFANPTASWVRLSGHDPVIRVPALQWRDRIEPNEVT